MTDLAEEWWAQYFDEVFLRVYRPLLTPARTAAEIEAISELLPRESRKKLLDVGCGWGRHPVALAAEGYDVTGVDLSAYLLDVARHTAAEAGVQVRWVRGDMRELPFEGEFDAAVSLFSSLGYFGSDEEDARVLRGIAAALKPDGLLLIETMHRDLVAREFAERDWWKTPEGDHVWVERDFDPIEGVSHETLHWRSADGSAGAKPHRIRVRSAPEWKRLLESCGFEPVDWFGDWELEPFTLTSERLIVVSRRS
ncbi:MAG: class I SAM-dependent methyltransferase [Gemmatimonadota bacterium]